MQLIWVVLLAALVNGLLLCAAAGFLNGNPGLKHIVLGALLGALLTAISLLPVADFFHSFAWRLTVLLATGLATYGPRGKGLGETALFGLLHLSLGGLTTLQTRPFSPVLGAFGICLACILTSRRSDTVFVELSCKGENLRLRALRDTGNTLLDPVTGRSVLVVDREIAERITGLQAEELSAPIRTMEASPGYRLIPIKTVSGQGFLLAKTLTNVKIGTWQGSALVAFSPQKFGSHYQALTGGME